MESLDGRHLFSFLSHLQSVGNEDDVILAGQGRKELRGERDPQLGELVEIEGWSVEEV